jgi:hypothetical protein
VLRLRNEIGGDELRIRGSIRQDDQLRRTASMSMPTRPETSCFAAVT